MSKNITTVPLNFERYINIQLATVILMQNNNVGNILTYLLTPWCRVLLEKLTGLQLVKKFPHFTEPEGSLPHSEASATRPYPGPAQSSSYTHIKPPGDPS